MTQIQIYRRWETEWVAKVGGDEWMLDSSAGGLRFEGDIAHDLDTLIGILTRIAAAKEAILRLRVINKDSWELTADDYYEVP